MGAKLPESSALLNEEAVKVLETEKLNIQHVVPLQNKTAHIVLYVW